MTIPSTGTISAAQIAAEIGSPFTVPGVASRKLTGRVAPAQITAPNDFYGQTGGGLCTEGSTNTATIAGFGSIPGVVIGNTAWNRRVVVCVHWACVTSDVETTLTDITIGGNVGVVHVSNGNGGTSTFSNYGCAIASATVPLGTTVTVTLTFSNGTSRSVLITAYRVTGLVSAAAYHNINAFDETVGAGTLTATGNLNIPSNGLAFFAATASSSGAIGSMGTTGITERQENTLAPDGRTSNGFQSGLGAQAGRAVSTSCTVTITGRLRQSCSSFQLQ